MSTIFVIEGAPAAVSPSRFILRDMVSLLGRSSECDIVINAPTISRRHAKISIRGSTVCVTDLGSRNGTFVDDQPIRKAIVENGQHLRFGDVSFVLSEQLLHGDERHSELETDECYSEENANMLRARALALSGRQRRVYELLISGISERQMALQLKLSQHTIHTHVRAIYKALQVHSRLELLACLLPPGERPARL